MKSLIVPEQHAHRDRSAGGRSGDALLREQVGGPQQASDDVASGGVHDPGKITSTDRVGARRIDSAAPGAVFSFLRMRPAGGVFYCAFVCIIPRLSSTQTSDSLDRILGRTQSGLEARL